MSVPAHLTLSQVARVMQVSRSTVNGWIAARRLASFRDGRVVRVSPDALMDFVERLTVVDVRRYEPSGAGLRDQVFWERVERMVRSMVEAISISQTGQGTGAVFVRSRERAGGNQTQVNQPSGNGAGCVERSAENPSPVVAGGGGGKEAAE
jgi:excisionase family DNA binding protein